MTRKKKPPHKGRYVGYSISEPDSKGRRIRVRAYHKLKPDPKRIAEVVVAIALERAEKLQLKRKRK